MNRIEIKHFSVSNHVEGELIQFPVSMRMANGKYYIDTWDSLFQRCFINPTEHDVIDSLYINELSLVDYPNETVIEEYKDVFYKILVGTSDKIFIYKELFEDFCKEFALKNDYFKIHEFMRNRIESKKYDIRITVNPSLRTLNRVKKDNCLILYHYEVVQLRGKIL